MQIKHASIMVDDQSKALAFYTGILGFAKVEDIPIGQCRWLTVSSPEGVGLGVKFLREPLATGPIKATVFEDTCGNLINLVQPQT
jgi:predicted enzyme related to lactoylglutathione lyase